MSERKTILRVNGNDLPTTPFAAFTAQINCNFSMKSLIVEAIWPTADWQLILNNFWVS